MLAPRAMCCGYCLYDGVTGLLGNIARSFALMSIALLCVLVCAFAGAGNGVGRTFTGRAGPGFAVDAAVPGRGPGEDAPLGPGLGAVPAVFATAAVCVGLGLGTPGWVIGDGLALEAGTGKADGIADAFTATTTAVGFGLGLVAAGAGV